MDATWEWSPEVRHQFANVLRDVGRVDDHRLQQKLKDDLMMLMHATTRVVDDAVQRVTKS